VNNCDLHVESYLSGVCCKTKTKTIFVEGVWQRKSLILQIESRAVLVLIWYNLVYTIEQL